MNGSLKLWVKKFVALNNKKRNNHKIGESLNLFSGGNVGPTGRQCCAAHPLCATNFFFWLCTAHSLGLWLRQWKAVAVHLLDSALHLCISPSHTLLMCISARSHIHTLTPLAPSLPCLPLSAFGRIARSSHSSHSSHWQCCCYALSMLFQCSFTVCLCVYYLAMNLGAIVDTENAVTLKGLLFCNSLFFKDILKRFMWTTYI